MYHQRSKSEFGLMHPHQAYCPHVLALLRVRQDLSVLYALGVLTTIMREQGCINTLERIHCRSTLGLISCHQTFPKVAPVTALVANMFFIRFLGINFIWLMYTRLHCNNNKIMK